MREWVEQAAEAFISSPEVDEGDIADTLIASGCDADLANVICEFLPSAFAAPTLEQLGVIRNASYMRHLTDGTSVKVKFTKDPVWLAVRDFVDQQRAGERWGRYEAIALRSAELDAINQARDSGVDVAGAVSATAPLYALPPDSEFLPDSVRRDRTRKRWRFW